jgi:hypothetical protein
MNGVNKLFLNGSTSNKIRPILLASFGGIRHFSVDQLKSNQENGYVKIDDNYENCFLRKVTMINEKQRNSLGIEMIRHLQSSIDSINLDKCRVLVLSSISPKVFSSGKIFNQRN